MAVVVDRCVADEQDGSVRIVSLLPSATEILFALGRGDDVVGVTFECDEPAEARQRRIVSTSALPAGLTPGEIDVVVKQRLAAGEDLYRLDCDALAELDPTMIVTQDLCAVCAVDFTEVDDALSYLGCRADVVMLDPASLDEVFDSVLTLGRATGTEATAARVVADCRSRLAAIDALVAGTSSPPTLVLEWTDPAFTAGHWVPDLVTAAGGRTVLARPGADSVSVAWPDITSCGAEFVLVAPCGYHLDGAAELAAAIVADGLLPDGAQTWALDADAYIVRPGPRLVDGVEAIAAILHPERTGPVDPTAARRIS
jgi:iron complex transport system substrate-binding protein